jgi:hypothetical protein
MTIPGNEELHALAQAAGDDPDRLSRLYNYIRLLMCLDEEIAAGQDPTKLYGLRAQIALARREL